MNAARIMKNPIPYTCLPDVTLEAVRQRMDQSGLDRLFVTDSEMQLRGCVDRDLICKALDAAESSAGRAKIRQTSSGMNGEPAKRTSATVADVMHRRFATCGLLDHLGAISGVFVARDVSSLPVIDDHGRLRGLVDRENIPWLAPLVAAPPVQSADKLIEHARAVEHAA